MESLNLEKPNGYVTEKSPAHFCKDVTVSQILTVLFEKKISFLTIYRVSNHKPTKIMLNYHWKGLIFDSFLIKIQSRIEVHV